MTATQNGEHGGVEAVPYGQLHRMAGTAWTPAALAEVIMDDVQLEFRWIVGEAVSFGQDHGRQLQWG